MRVRNITAITQIAPGGSLLEPAVWREVPTQVSYADAIWMLTRRMADINDVEDGEHLQWKQNGQTSLYWLSPFSMGDGYGTAAENMVLALTKLGVDLFVRQCWFIDRTCLDDVTRTKLKEHITGLYRVGICMATPGEFTKLPTAYRIGFTMYESDDPLEIHPEWRHDCYNVDMLIVPSEFSKEAFGTFVKHVPIEVCPLALNDLYCVPTLRKPKKDGSFKFVTYGSLTGRKAPLELLEVFKRAFPIAEYPRVTLEFKTRLGLFGWGENMLPDNDDPRITIKSADWFPNQMLDWLLGADAMVFPSKGEGYALPPREAMATGLPTIFTANTGMLDFVNDKYNWPIPTHHTEDSPLGGVWHIAHWNYLIDVMRSVYRNRKRAFDKAFRGAKWYIENFSSRRAAERLMEIVDNVDPPTSSVRKTRLPKVPNLKEHQPFIELLQRELAPGSVIWDIGLGSTEIHHWLREIGFQVFALVDEENNFADKFGVNVVTCNLLTEQQHTLVRDGLPKADACIFCCNLQRFSIQEIRVLLIKTLAFSGEHGTTSGKVFFNVPSVYYPHFYDKDSLLMRETWWRRTLKRFVYSLKPYGKGKRFFMFEVSGEDKSQAAFYLRLPGHVLQGVWHPTLGKVKV